MIRPGWLPCAIALLAVACESSKHDVFQKAPPPRGLPRSVNDCSVSQPDPPRLYPCSCSGRPELGWCQSEAAPEPRDARAELVRAAALDVLAYRCSECHLSLHARQTLAEPTSIDDLDALVASGHILPLNSSLSPLYQRSASGEMPPPGSGLPALDQAELDVLASLIDTPRFWPQLGAPIECEASLTDLDSVFQSVASDLATLPREEAGFYRYLSLSNRSNTVCYAAQLEGDRQALALGLNLLSRNPSLHAPLAIDEARQLYRIDLRDFDWARGIDMAGLTFRDVWEAIAWQSPYSVRFSGDAASQAQAATGTAFPLLFADHVLDQALVGELYYAILGLHPEETWAEFQLRALDLDWNRAIENSQVQRAGTTRSRTTQDDRLAERVELGGRGVLWRVTDIPNDGGGSIFQDPLEYGGRQDQVMFSLPNGLFAFLSIDANDALVAEGEVLFETDSHRRPIQGPASCLVCHASGLIPVVDQLKAWFLSGAPEIGLNAADLEQVERIYPEPAAFLERIAYDSARFQQGLNQLQLPSTGSSPIVQAALRFDAPLTLRDAAAELGVRADVLAGNLPRWLSPLESGTLGRDEFAAVYVASLCVLSESWANRPDPATCERALQVQGGP
ncbi:MAG TPA: hypothetical protein VJU61_17770 [Polyangiaceae bacterium]|nr:hypothetical protein [Polyangiaceae bacterium]